MSANYIKPMYRLQEITERAEWIKAKLQQFSTSTNPMQIHAELEAQFHTNEYFCQSLFSIIELSSTPTQLKQITASLINNFLKAENRGTPTSLIKIYFRIFFNWELPYNIKIMLKQSFGSALLYVDKYAQNFFENVLQILVDSLNQLMSDPPSQSVTFTTKQILSPNIEESFRIQFQFPGDTFSIYQTIFLMAEQMASNMYSKDDKYRSKLASNVRKVHFQLIKTELMTFHLRHLRNIFNFWIHFNAIAMEQNDSFKPLYNEIGNWEQLTSHFQMVYEYKSLSYGDLGIKSYLIDNTSKQHLDSIYKLKQSALEVHMQFASMIYSRQHDLATTCPIIRHLSRIKGNLQFTMHQLTRGRQLIQSEKAFAQMLLYAINNILRIQQQTSHVQIDAILSSIALPILEQQIESHKIVYQGMEIQEFFIELEDCCDAQKNHTLIALACKCIQTLVDKQEYVCEYLRNYIRYSFIQNYNLQDENWQMAASVQGLKPLSTPTCFLILGIIAYKQEQQNGLEWMQKMLIQSFFCQLTEYDLIFLYLFLSYSWQKLDYNHFEALTLLSKPLQKDCPTKLKYVGLKLINDIISEQNCPEYFYMVYVQAFKELQGRIRWKILHNIIEQSIQCFNQQTLLFLMITARQQSEKLIQVVLLNMEQERLSDTTQIFDYIYLCEMISKQHEVIRSKPSIINQLLRVVKQIKFFDQIEGDNQIANIAGEILQSLKQFPPGFNHYLQDIIEVFTADQYQGLGYFFVFGICLIVEKENPNDQILNIVANIIIEGLSYFAFFPQSLNHDSLENIGNFQFLALNLLLLQSQKLIKERLSDIQKSCVDLQKNIKSSNDNISNVGTILVRNANIMLLLQHILSKKYDFKHLIALAHSKAYYNKFDKMVLAYILDLINSDLEFYHRQSVLELLFIIFKNSFEINKSDTQETIELNKRINKILTYVQSAAAAFFAKNFIHQCGILVYHIKEQHYELYRLFRNRCFQLDRSLGQTLQCVVQLNEEVKLNIDPRPYQPLTFSTPQGEISLDDDAEFKNSKPRTIRKVAKDQTRMNELSNFKESEQLNFISLKRCLDQLDFGTEKPEQGKISKRVKRDDQTKRERIRDKVMKKSLKKSDSKSD